ncbi:MAG: SLC13 family permease, partial [Planctomycetota bacterium]
ARAILVLTVVLIAGRVFDIFLGASLGAGLMILTGCCRVSEARRAIDWSVLIAMGSGLALGEALDQTGGAALVADAAIGLVAGNAHATLAVVLLLTMACANLMTAKAAATLFFPIAMNAAAALDGANHMPFAVAVIVASAGTFATPVGYQTNLMVFGPGGYRPSDYLRVGGPLSLVVAAVAVITIPLAWPF